LRQAAGYVCQVALVGPCRRFDLGWGWIGSFWLAGAGHGSWPERADRFAVVLVVRATRRADLSRCRVESAASVIAVLMSVMVGDGRTCAVRVVPSDICDLADLAVCWEAGQPDRDDLALGQGWSSRWSTSWTVGGCEVIWPVRDLTVTRVAGCEPVRRFGWRTGQRHRPGPEFPQLPRTARLGDLAFPHRQGPERARPGPAPLITRVSMFPPSRQPGTSPSRRR
jgi:hypothetical protein